MDGVDDYALWTVAPFVHLFPFAFCLLPSAFCLLLLLFLLFAFWPVLERFLFVVQVSECSLLPNPYRACV